MNVLLLIDFPEIVPIVLIIAFLLLLYRYMESFWSYRISKPHAWEKGVKSKQISKELIRLERHYKDKVRFYNLWFQIERLKKNKVKGDFVELGVHQGETAKVIHFMDKNRKFYLFDTFEGFSEKDLKHETQNDPKFATDMFADTSIDKVKKYMNGNENLIFKPGFFPETAKGLEKNTFSFVNIDADLYAPTIEALKFFYPRMSKGGVIIIHDYNHNWDGIPKAIDAFLETIPEALFELSDWQGSAMIIKNS